jgi:hypothetical protein
VVFMNKRIICIKLMYYLLNHVLKPFFKLGDDKIWLHYRNLVALMLTMNNPQPYKFLVLANKYVYSTNTGRRYYGIVEAEYLEVNNQLVKSLFDEISILKIQGAETILSRVLFLLASINRIEVTRDTLLNYLSKINTILSIPTPPKASNARIIDLATEQSRIGLFIGTVNAWWVINVLIRLLAEKNIDYELIVFDDSFEDYITFNNINRYIQNQEAKISIAKQEHLNIGELSKRYDLLVIANYLAVMKIVEEYLCLGEKTMYGENTLLVFNPISTPLEEVFGMSPIVINADDVKNFINK